jgi:hypothetical protein
LAVESDCMSDYLSFKRFITTTFIMLIYVLGAIFVTIGAILLMAFGGAVGIVGGVIMLILGNLGWRLLCEYWVVQFRIYEEIASLNRRLGGPVAQAGPSAPVAPAAAAPVAAAGVPTCPSCGSPIRYIQQYQRWYCDKEQKYV